MSINTYFSQKIAKIILSLFISLLLLTTNCSKDPMDPNRPISAEEKRKKNLKEGKGVSLGGLTKGMGGTTYEFSTSNPLWRASLETLDFLPLTTVDYSGGVIITDWYSDNNTGSSDAIKISIRFLANEIRSESLKVTVHKKTCSANLNCKVTLLNKTKIKEELHTTIIRKAALLEKESKSKKKN